MDARDLPFYVLINGQPCPVCLIIIYDDFTGYIVGWKLVIKALQTDKGRYKRNSFTSRDVCEMIATAMYTTGRMPEEFYTDNGSQFIALKPMLPSLMNQNGHFPILVNSRPGKPWGRGRVEGGLGRVNKLLRNLPGAYKKGDRTTIKEARQKALPLEKIVPLFEEHFRMVNQASQRRKPSRHDQYWSAVGSQPRPSFARMMALDIEAKPDWVPVNHKCFYALGTEYEPKLREEDSNSDIYRLWLDTVTACEARPTEQLLHIFPLRLDIGWRIEMHLIGEKTEAWVEAVPKGSQDIDKGRHNHDQQRALKDAVEDWRQLTKSDEDLLRQYCTDLPELNPATGHYTLTKPVASDEINSHKWDITAITAEHAPQADAVAPTSQSKKQSRPRPPQMRDVSEPASKTPEPKKLPIDLPDIDELMAAL